MMDTAPKEKSLEYALARELRALDNQSESHRETEFYLAVEDLLDRFGLSASHAADILLSDQPVQPDVQPQRPTSAVPLKVFRNPYTREVVRTRGFNHQTLNAWRKRHGRVTVQTWRIK